MAVFSVPLRVAEVERVPLWRCPFHEVGVRSVAREFSAAIATGIPGKQLLGVAFSDRNSTRPFLTIQP
jgi:hypothetical protein